MPRLLPCSRCAGFVPARASSCPHCGASSSSSLSRLRLRALGGAFGGGAIAFTLMACYGGPPCDPGQVCGAPPPRSSQTDGARDDERADAQLGGDAEDADADASSGDAASDAADADAGDADAADADTADGDAAPP